VTKKNISRAVFCPARKEHMLMRALYWLPSLNLLTKFHATWYGHVPLEDMPVPFVLFPTTNNNNLVEA
jgi:hypothetical protein